MGYKVLGFVVWQGGRWYLRRRANQAWARVPARGLVVGLLVAAGVGGMAAAAHRRSAA